MAVDTETAVLVKELNKLKKDELIDIIVKKKLPSSANNTVLVNFVGRIKDDEIRENKDIFYDSQDGSGCSRCEKLQDKLEAIEKLAAHLEKRTGEQEDLILLLKQGNNLFSSNMKIKNIQSQMVHQASSSSSLCNEENSIEATTQETSLQEQSHNPPKTYVSAAKTDRPTKRVDSTYQSNNGNSHQQKQKINGDSIRPKNNNKPIIGCGGTSIETLPKLGYLYVYRCGPNVTSDDLQSMLQQNAPEIKFVSELWKKTEQSTSFKVSFPIDHYKEVYNPSLWPTGVAIRRFIFRRRNFSIGSPSSQGQ
nr:unnamed protein product [Callosobruchus chinensis]